MTSAIDTKTPAPARHRTGHNVVQWARAVLRRPTGREALRAIMGGLVLTVVINWPIVANISTQVPHERSDPFMMAWRIAWPWHAATDSNATLWNSNSFYPEKDSFAFTDTLLGYAPLGIFVDGPSEAIIRYNIAFLSAFLLAFVGCYALARQLGAAWPAATLAGIVLSCAPWTLAHGNHLNILSTGGITLAFFGLARGLGFSFVHGYQPEKVRVGWIVFGWAMACWQITIGFAIGLAFVYVLGIITLLAIYGWIAALRPRLPRRATVVIAAGWAVFLLVTYAMASPMLRVSEHYDAERSIEEVRGWSAPWQGLFISPQQSWAWGDNHLQARLTLPYASEQTLLPGYVVLALGLIGLFYSAWKIWVRIALAIGAILMGILAIGTNFFDGTYTYVPLFENAPGFNGIRVPGRLVLWAALCLALLAAGTVTKLYQQLRMALKNAGPNGFRMAACAALVPALLALGEGFPEREYPAVPKAPPAVEKILAENNPVLLLPASPWDDSTFMLWSAGGWAPMANGITGFFPPVYWEITREAANFPTEYSVALLRAQGIRTVVVLPDHIAGTLYEHIPDRPIAGLGITRENTSGAIIYRL